MSETSSPRRSSRRRQAVIKSANTSSSLGRDRWLLSYADFITLLFAFFVALYSIAIQHKGDEVRLTETLYGVFDAVQKSIKPINIGEPIIGDPKDIKFEDAAPVPAATPVADKKPQDTSPSVVFSLLKQVVEEQFQGLQQSGQINISESADWVSLELKSGLLFGESEYELSNEAVALLMLVSNVMISYPSVIMVEGNTDNLPTNSSRLASNWHLSSLRAASVVDELVYQGVNPKMIAPIGFSSERPKVRNTNTYARQQNRRVTLRISKRNASNLYDYLFK
ncbi:OmpA family protein [Marinomonas transparens]|uniref:OmpA family protein n=1 Tax=Marinomonas transparens TaxID=2795388 RepID=A0A934JR84_9GAMM|nr:OmpA family protein [Marinomonas transparens]MBJ7536781.1 OmpA family protein [Marinomonas transparens]